MEVRGLTGCSQAGSLQHHAHDTSHYNICPRQKLNSSVNNTPNTVLPRHHASFTVQLQYDFQDNKTYYIHLYLYQKGTMLSSPYADGV